MSERMVSKERTLIVVKDELGRVVAIAVYLFEDDTALLVNLVLGEGAMKDDVGKQLQGTCEIFLQKSRVHHGLLLIGVGIKVTAHVLHTIEDVPGAAFGSAFKEHVLYEVSETSLVGQLVASTSIDGIAAISHRGGRWSVYDAQAIGQRMGIVGSCGHIYRMKKAANLQKSSFFIGRFNRKSSFLCKFVRITPV